MDAGGVRGEGTHQNIPSLLAMGSQADTNSFPCSAPSSCLAPRAPSKTHLVLNNALQFLSSRSNQQHGKASMYPPPCPPCARDSLAQQCPWLSGVLHIHRDPTQGKPTNSHTKLSSQEVQSALTTEVNCPGQWNQHQNSTGVKNKLAAPAQIHNSPRGPLFPSQLEPSLHFSISQRPNSKP